MSTLFCTVMSIGTDFFAQRVRVYISVILELLLDHCPSYWHRLVRQICGYVVLGVSLQVEILTKIYRRSRIDGSARTVLVWSRRQMVWNEAVHSLHV